MSSWMLFNNRFGLNWHSPCLHLSFVLHTEGEDFQPVIRNITFLPQESTTKEVPLEIVNDDREEGDENLIINVRDVSGQRVSVVPINVTIIDDEGAYLNAKCSNIEAFVVSQALHKDVD